MRVKVNPATLNQVPGLFRESPELLIFLFGHDPRPLVQEQDGAVVVRYGERVSAQKAGFLFASWYYT
jgi:hypothetical protein